MAFSDPRNVELLVLDVDGVLTPGNVAVEQTGSLRYHFDVQDGSGIKYWLRSGGRIAIITGRSSNAVAIRAKELGIDLVYQAALRKIDAYRDCLGKLGIGPERVCCLGDDLPDLPIMLNCGYPAAVANAVREVKQYAAYITNKAGGYGAVRELIEHLLSAKGLWSGVVSGYVNQSL